jgi:hypothetical protein
VVRKAFNTALALVLVIAAPVRAQEHDMSTMNMSADTGGYLQFHWGAHAVGLLTRVSPAIANKTLVEAYLTQPSLMGGVQTRDGHFAIATTISLEGLTLDRGELGPGTYGEGYVDRRHPHTYLHELVATAHTDLPYGFDASVTAGRGFAPFGTDDPMMRPFVRFPVNHHLSQVLERLVVIGGVRNGPVTLEVGSFGGNEPLSPKDLGDPDRFGDSWAARVTLRPTDAWELQVSRASVKSPEEPTGQGDDQRKIRNSARHDGMLGDNHIYGLAEYSKTTIVQRRGDVYATHSLLAEASLARSDWRGAIRVERTERPEEGRIGDFRAPWPPYDHLVIGVTQWNVASARVQKDVRWKSLAVSPFVETSLAHVAAKHSTDLFQPQNFYGSNTLWSLSAGMRLNLGMQHDRMGRYGVALPRAPMKMDM